MRTRLITTTITSILVAGLALGMLPAASAATLTSTQKAKLQYLIEEEKLARDVYAYLAANVTTRKFSNIVKSEQTHMDQISALLTTYKVTNPTLNKPAGVFTNTTLAKLYKSLTIQGKASSLEAFNVGVTIEKMDIGDLVEIRKLFTQSDVLAAIDLLDKGSQNHLAAFSR